MSARPRLALARSSAGLAGRHERSGPRDRWQPGAACRHDGEDRVATGARELRDALGALALLLVLAPGGPGHAQNTPSTVALPAGAQGVEYNAAANRLYVAVASLNQVLALDATSN